MKILLDSHVIIWILADNQLLNTEARKILEDFDQIVYISPVSIAEISIKESKGKLKIPTDYVDILQKEGYEEFPLRISHTHHLSRLPFHHQDSFDRLLICQAVVEDIAIMSNDAIFAQYDVEVIRAK